MALDLGGLLGGAGGLLVGHVASPLRWELDMLSFAMVVAWVWCVRWLTLRPCRV
ncbi:MAG: hypothetical protein M5U27_11990 [Gaiella sp.]|nr:hypothetical protein [Gaiella sp.]